MKNMKKILLIVLFVIVLLVGIFCLNKPNKNIQKSDNNALLKNDNYRIIKNNNIKSIEVIKYKESGTDSKILEKEEEIIKIYNMLNKKYIGNKCYIHTDDNTIIYNFTLYDDTKVSIEIEGDCVIIENQRYFLK